MQNKTTKQAHEWLKNHLFEGAIAVDATCGNGYDTLFLAEQVGKSGKVFAYDIQTVAILNTKEKLKTLDLIDRVVFFNHSHEKLEADLQIQNTDISVIIFNLGYLPQGDKDITTKTQSSMTAIRQAFKILKPEGILSVTTYPGHPEGALEDLELSTFFNSLCNKANIKLFTSENTKRPAPKLYFIKKSTS